VAAVEALEHEVALVEALPAVEASWVAVVDSAEDMAVVVVDMAVLLAVLQAVLRVAVATTPLLLLLLKPRTHSPTLLRLALRRTRRSTSATYVPVPETSSLSSEWRG
jgi:hypothetical protein